MSFSEAQACFDFDLALRTGWLHRRVESWGYEGNSQWRVNISLDINQPRVQEMFERDVLDRATLPERICSVVNIPVLYVRKSVQFDDFSVKDGRGNTMRLLLRSMGCHVALSQLEGAILTVHGAQSAVYQEEQLPPLSKKPDLKRFLLELFDEPVSPRRGSGDPISLNDLDVYEAVEEYAIRAILSRSEGNPDWGVVTVAAVRNDFEIYWRKSRVFRYLVTLNTLRWTACVRVDLKHDDASIVKASFLTVRNIVNDVQRTPYDRDLLSGRVALDVELDGLGVGEVSHVVVHAPEGTRFVESRPKGEQGALACVRRFLGKTDSTSSLGSREAPKAKFFIVKQLFDEVGEGAAAQALAYGSVTPRCVSVEAKMGWAPCEVSAGEGDERLVLDRLYRRVPIHDSQAGIYTLCLSLAPDLNARAVGYFAYFALSLLVMLAWLQLLDVSDASTNSTALTILLALAPIIVAIVLGGSGEPYIRRKTFKGPLVLSGLCTAINVFAFLFLALRLFGDMPFGLGLHGWNVLIIGVTAMLNVIYVLWYGFHWLNAYRTFCGDFYRVADVPIVISQADEADGCHLPNRVVDFSQYHS